MTNAEFVARFPEFDQVNTDAPDAISGAIDAASMFVDATRWGSRYSAALAYKAAHLLAMTPMGENARLQQNSQDTTYGLVFQEMLRALPVRILGVGMNGR